MEETQKYTNRAQRRQKIKESYKNKPENDLIYIPAKKQLPPSEDAPKKRTAAYCRVSTDDPAQTTSYELQKEHYEEEINKNSDWIFAGIYADEGISATSMKHRENFNRLIADCEAGKIDMIVTKSVSRFARNVVDCLSVVRHLSSLKNPVGVRFETEGINTLDSTSEMILTVMAASAQEESKNKSNSMIWSLEKRFEKGRFLTPVLLGYDHDEDGNLIINDDEANTVRFMYYLYLLGHTPSEIAEILTLAKRKTKLGNTVWSSSTVRAVLRNERHCGDVLSWKTFTYDFWEHKSRKNNQDRPQVLEKDHHEGIVSHEVYDATQLKLESEKYMRHGIPIPTLEVVDDGVLKGFVPVNRLWSGFSASDYEEASLSAYETENIAAKDSLDDTFSLDGYEIVRSNFFSTGSKPLMTIAKGQVRFNSVCLKKFENVEYVELLLNSVEQCIAVRPCDKDNPNAIKWGKLKNSRWIVSPKSCAGFSGALYSIMDWEADCGYKLCGQYMCDGEEQVLFFDLSDPEITQYVLEEKTDTDIYKKEDGADDGNKSESCTYQKVLIIPSSWENSFGRKVSERGDISFSLKKYKGNWDVMRPSSVYRICGNITEETLEAVRRDGEKLLMTFRESIQEEQNSNGDIY